MKEDKYKFVDDLSIFEVINLIGIGLSSYNFKEHVASDVGIGQSFIPSANPKSQSDMDKICQWTSTNKMKLNQKKSKVMVFSCTKNFQFSTRIHLDCLRL